MRRVEAHLGQLRRAQPVLVRHHDESETCAFEFLQRRKDSRHQANLLEAVDLLVGSLFVQGSVAIEKYDAFAAHGASRLASRESLSVRVPTVTRKLRGSAGLARRSRTMRPPSMLRRMKVSASVTSSSKKFVSLGQTVSTRGEAARPLARYSRSASSIASRARVASSSAGSSARS